MIFTRGSTELKTYARAHKKEISAFETQYEYQQNFSAIDKVDQMISSINWPHKFSDIAHVGAVFAFQTAIV